MKLKLLVVIVCALLVGCSSESAKKDPPKKDPSPTAPVSKSPMEQFVEIKAQYDSAINDYRDAIRQAAPNERQKVYEERYPDAADYSGQLFELAEDNPGSEAAFESLQWIVSYDRGGSDVDDCYETLFSDHLDNEGFKRISSVLVRGEPGPRTEARLDQIIERSPHDSVKAAATFALASYFTQLEKTKQFMADDPERAAKSFGDEVVKYVSSFEAQPEVVESLYETVINKYPDIKRRDGDDTTYKSMAESALFELRNLAIGKVAPDIEGEDLDGKPFKLSDYRGKVVVLDFWGDW